VYLMRMTIVTPELRQRQHQQPDTGHAEDAAGKDRDARREDCRHSARFDIAEQRPATVADRNSPPQAVGF
jgi:hypothetical protein